MNTIVMDNIVLLAIVWQEGRRMGVVISIFIEAGGAGKTNTTLHTAWELAMRGKKVLMIDLDGQSGNLTFFTGIADSDDRLTMYDVLQKKKDIHSAIVPVRENLDLVPANFDVIDISPMRAGIDRMQEVIGLIRDEYDYIFIDNNPDPTYRHALTLSTADNVVVLMTGDYKSLESGHAVLESVSEMRKVNPSIRIAGFLFNRFDQRLSIARQVYATAEQMAANNHSRIFHTIIRQDIMFTESSAVHKGITECAPKTRGSEDIRSFADELEEVCREQKK